MVVHRWRTVAQAMVLTLALAAPAAAQNPQASRDSLRAQLARIDARLDSLEQGACPAEPLRMPAYRRTGDAVTDSLIADLGRIAERLSGLARRVCPGAAAAAEPQPAIDDLAALRAAADSAAGEAPQPTADTAGAPAPPPPNLNKYNPEISVTGDFRAFLRDNERAQDNFEVREVEIAFQSNLDPFSKTKAFLSIEDGEINIEEAYLYWPGLIGGIRLDAGKFRQSAGDLNRWHSHALPEGEYPLVYRRFFGDEGLEGIGVSLYSILPLSIGGGTHEATLQATTAPSDPLFDGATQPMLLGRLLNFWQVSRSSYVQLGFTGLGGSNSDADLRTRVAGVDARFTYRPPRGGQKELTLRTEGYLFHSREAGVVTDRYGMFAQANYRTGKRWVLGARYDWVEAPRGGADTEWAIVPSVTWWQSEFVYLRLEGLHADSDLAGERNQVNLQVVWSFGPHKHETY